MSGSGRVSSPVPRAALARRLLVGASKRPSSSTGFRRRPVAGRRFFARGAALGLSPLHQEQSCRRKCTGQRRQRQRSELRLTSMSASNSANMCTPCLGRACPLHTHHVARLGQLPLQPLVLPARPLDLPLRQVCRLPSTRERERLQRPLVALRAPLRNQRAVQPLASQQRTRAMLVQRLVPVEDVQRVARAEGPGPAPARWSPLSPTASSLP